MLGEQEIFLRRPPPRPSPVESKSREDRGGSWVMGTPVAPQAYLGDRQRAPAASTWIPINSVSSPGSNDDINGISPSSYAPHSVAAAAHGGGGGVVGLPPSSNSNPYVQLSPLPGSLGKSPMDTMLKVLNRCGKKFEDTARNAGATAGNVWNHLKAGSSLTDAAMARLSQGTKVLAEGGHDKVFRQTFDILPGEQLQKAYACYLSTSSGPLIGTLYVSTVKLAFCSDKPLCYYIAPGRQDSAYYKVAVQLDQLRAVNPSANFRYPAEKYIQIVTADNYEFWFMGFVSYDKAFKHLCNALQNSHH